MSNRISKLIFAVYGLVAITVCNAQTDTIVHIARYSGDKICAISYTFDDGLKEHYTMVTPVMNRLGFKGTFVINGSKINKDEKSVSDTTRMTWGNLKDMSRAGHEISNHGWAHKNFNKFPLDEIKEDIRKNDSAIFANIGIMPRTFAYPNNAQTSEVQNLLLQIELIQGPSSDQSVGSQLKKIWKTG